MIHQSPLAAVESLLGAERYPVFWSANKKLSQSFRSSQNTQQTVGLVPINELT